MVCLHTGTMGVHPACFFINRAWELATSLGMGTRCPEAESPLPILRIYPLVAHQLASARQDLTVAG